MGASVQGGGGSGRLGRPALAEINVTPLVDVMLVLLIISMVAAPMLERSINLELPETRTAAEIQEARLVVSMDREGRLRINDKPVHEELFLERIKAQALADPAQTVYLRADKLMAYGEVLRVMDQIRTAGLTHVALVTVPLDVPGES